MKEPKFKIGDVLKHKSLRIHNCHRLLVIGVGTIKNDDGESIIYALSFEKQFTSNGEQTFVRVILEENEVELFDAAIPVRNDNINPTIK